MPRDINAEHKQSRWYKKQLLDRSDKELQARMEKEGHSFLSKMALKIKEAMRHTRTSVIRTASTSNGLDDGNTLEFSANRALLPLMGFRSLGGSFVKLGHGTWEVVGQDGDVTVRRLQEETKEAAAFPKRKNSSFSLMDETLGGLGYPSGVMAQFGLGEKMAISQSRTAYCLPANPILIRGLPARVLARDGEHFMVEFLGTGIFDRQPIAKIYDRDANSRLAALQESVEARIASGDFSLEAQQELEKELSADPVITRAEIEEFAQSAEDAKKEALTARLTRCEQGSETGSGPREAQSEPHVAVRDIFDLCDGSPHASQIYEMWETFCKAHGRDPASPRDACRGLKKEVRTEFIDPARKLLEGKTAQMQRQWQDFNSAKVRDFSPTLHGAVVLTDEAHHLAGGEALTQVCKWELYEGGKLVETGLADTMGEGQEDCGSAADTLDTGNTPMLQSGDMTKEASNSIVVEVHHEFEGGEEFQKYTLKMAGSEFLALLKKGKDFGPVEFGPEKFESVFDLIEELGKPTRKPAVYYVYANSWAGHISGGEMA